MTFDQNKYYKDRYHSDPEYRKNRIVWSHKWSKKNRKQINAGNRKRYAKRSLQQIKKHKLHLKEMRASGKWKR